MKTISINNRSNLFKVLGVVGVLGAIYFFRRRGGTVSGLITQGKGLAGRVKEQATDAYSSLTDGGSDMKDGIAKVRSGAKAGLKDMARDGKSHAKSDAKTDSKSDASSVH